MPQYQEKYVVGSPVRVASSDKLRDFYANWQYHNKLTSEQLDYADAVTKVAAVSFYQGGDVLYRLKDVPGIWHEECLVDAT